jgi:hypothetical protein
VVPAFFLDLPPPPLSATPLALPSLPIPLGGAHELVLPEAGELEYEQVLELLEVEHLLALVLELVGGEGIWLRQ